MTTRTSHGCWRAAPYVRRGSGLLLMASVCIGCTGPGEDDGTVSFSQHVQPILTNNCAGCHSPGGMADLAGIKLQLSEGVAFESMVNQPSFMSPELMLVAPGDSAASMLMAKINSDTPPVGDRMPSFSPPLTREEINLIRDWIDQGAMNN